MADKQQVQVGALMTSRERAVRAMSFTSPDRVPITYGCSGRALLRHGVTPDIIPDLIEIGLNSF